MTDQQATSILRRKTAAAAADGAGAVITAERVLRMCLAKVAQDMMELPLQVVDILPAKRTLGEMLDGVEEKSMFCVVEGPKESLGVVVLPSTSFSAIVEMQTMGQLAKTVPEPRRPTRVDAAMVQEFFDLVLEALDERLVESEDIVWAGHFRYASFLDDARPLSLILEDILYRCLRVTMRIGPGLIREIEMVICLPAAGRGERPTPAAGVVLDAADAHWAQAMNQTVMSTRAELTAVLHRWSMPLADAMGLSPGMEIPVPRDALEKLRIEGSGRRRVAIARLGQHSGKRAVRVLDDAAEDAQAQAEPDHGAFNVGESPFGGLGAGADTGGVIGAGFGADLEGGFAGLGDGGAGEDPMNGLAGFGGFGDQGGEMPDIGLPMGGLGDDEDEPFPAMKTA